MNQFAFLVVAFLFQIISVSVAVCPETISGLTPWSTWSNKPTSTGADVTVQATDKILLDVTPPSMHKLEIFGTVVVSPSVDYLELNASFIYVRSGGHFWAGAEDCPYTKKLVVTLEGVPQKGVNPDNVGTKVFGVFAGGFLDLHGAVRTPTWTYMAQSASVGDTKITLIEDVDWAVGEIIALAGTDFYDDFSEGAYPGPQTERLTITGRPATNVVQFAEPLTFPHYSKIWTSPDNGDSVDLRAEVGMYTRNIVVRGDDSGTSVADAWGGHIMIRDGGNARIEYIEVYKMGQAGELGRYPIHYHAAGDQSISYARGNSIHNTYQRCFTIHSTFNLRVQNNVAYNSRGHCYFIEDGNEEGNVLEHNLGMYTRVLNLLTSDQQPAIFWITNPHNHFYNNAAVEAKFGYWYAMPSHPLALSSTQTGNRLRYKVMGDFSGNRAHGCNTGLFVDEGLNEAFPGTTSLSSYYPVNINVSLDLAAKMTASGLDVNTNLDLSNLDDYSLSQLGVPTPGVFRNFVAYKCSDTAMWGRGGWMWAVGARLADNTVGTVWPGGPNLFSDAVIVGETDNVGFTNYPQDKYMPDQEGRSRPKKWYGNYSLIGYSSYDAGGGDVGMDIRFHNFNDFTFKDGSVRATGAISGITGPNVIQPINRLWRNKFYNVQNRVFVHNWLIYQTSPDLDQVDDAVKGWTMVDADGSILAGIGDGSCGRVIVGNGPHIRTSSCTAMPAWNAYICPANQNAYHSWYFGDQSGAVSSPFTSVDEMRTQTSLHVTRMYDGATVAIEAHDDYDSLTADYSYGTTLISNQYYWVTYGTANQVLSNFQINSGDFVPGDWWRFVIPFPAGTTFTVGQDGGSAWTQVTKESDLGYQSWFWDSSANLFYIHFSANISDLQVSWKYGIPQYLSWTPVNVKASGSGCDATFCTYAAGTKMPSKPAPTGPTTDYCETSAAVTNSYAPKTSSVYTIFDDTLNTVWQNDNKGYFVPTTSVFYEGTTSLLATLDGWGQVYLTRTWQDGQNNKLTGDSYTHFQMAIRIAPGLGNQSLLLSGIDPNWAMTGDSIRINHPKYVNDHQAISDYKWSVVTVPLSEFMQYSNNLYGIVIVNAGGRPIQFYVDSIKLISVTQTTTVLAGYPAAPAVPALVGPGPQFKYGTQPSTSSSAPSASSDQASNIVGANGVSVVRVCVAMLFAVLVIAAL